MLNGKHIEFKSAPEVTPYTIPSASTSAILSEPPVLESDVMQPSVILPPPGIHVVLPSRPATPVSSAGTESACNQSDGTGNTASTKRKLVLAASEMSAMTLSDAPATEKAAEAALSPISMAPTTYCQDSGIRFSSDAAASTSNVPMNTANPLEQRLKYVPPSYSEV